MTKYPGVECVPFDISTNELLEKAGEAPLSSGATAAELLRRPPVHYTDVCAMLRQQEAAECQEAPPRSALPRVSPFIAYCIEVEVKYEGYIKRQRAQIEQVRRQEKAAIPSDFAYQALTGLSLEAREKLAKIAPRTLAQAARIPGVGPADIACLAVVLAKQRRAGAQEG